VQDLSMTSWPRHLPSSSALLTGNLTLSPALLRLDPMFDPLRNDPRFQKLVASPAPKKQ